jgi:midasin
MRETGAGAGALAALATLATGLTQLEVGEMAVMRFGDGVHVERDFDSPPFTAEDGAEALKKFTFKGESTPANELLVKSIELFDNADNRSHGGDLSGGGEASNQMMFIISDGLFHQGQLESLRALERQLSEKKRLLVFLLVNTDPNRSIEKERKVIMEGSEMRIERYLEGFPFPYYIVLKDISLLPEVVSDALSQWFELLQQGQS